MTTYIYCWRRYLGMPVCGGDRKGQECVVLARGKRNSALIRFSDGYEVVTSGNALKRQTRPVAQAG